MVEQTASTLEIKAAGEGSAIHWNVGNYQTMWCHIWEDHNIQLPFTVIVKSEWETGQHFQNHD